MATLNVTKDIKKLAEEAEKDKNNNLALAGLGLGGGVIASQTGGVTNTTTKPTNLTMQANIAQQKANQAKAMKEFRNLGNLNTSTQVTIPDPTGQKPNFPKPTFTAERKLDTRPMPDADPLRGSKPAPDVTTQDFDKSGRKITATKPKPNAPILGKFDPMKGFTGTVKSLGKSLRDPRFLTGTLAYEAGSAINERLGISDAIAEGISDVLNFENNEGLRNFLAENRKSESRFEQAIGGIGNLYNTAMDTAGNVLEGTARILPETADYFFSRNPQTDNPLSSAYGKAFNDDPLAPETTTAPVMQTQATTTAPVMQEQRVPDADLSPEDLKKRYDYENRTPDEQRVIDNMIAGRPVVDTEGQTNQQVMDERAKLPSYQQNFLARKDTGAPITSDEFKRAQFFAINQGMTFDPETGYSEAEFPYQMYKGQTIGDFLQGETLPEQFRTAEPEADPLQAPAEPTATEAEDTALTSRDVPQSVREIIISGVKTAEDRERLGRFLGTTKGKQFGTISALQDAILGQRAPTETEEKRTELAERQATLAEAKFDFSKSDADRAFNLAEDRFEEAKRAGKASEEIEQERLALSSANTYSLIVDRVLRLKADTKEEVKTPTKSDIDGFNTFLDTMGYELDKGGEIVEKGGFFGGGRAIRGTEEYNQLLPFLSRHPVGRLLGYTK